MSVEFMDAAKDRMLDEASGNAAYFLSAHTADPGTTGTNEVTGGDYAREEATYAAASGGEKAITAVDPIEIPENTDVEYVGVWDAVTAGNFIGKRKLTPTIEFIFAGQLVVNDLTLTLADPS